MTSSATETRSTDALSPVGQDGNAVRGFMVAFVLSLPIWAMIAIMVLVLR